MIGGSTKATVGEIAEGSEDALATAIGNMDAVDGGSVAGLLDARMPSSGTLARKSDTGGTDWSTKTPSRVGLPKPSSKTTTVSGNSTVSASQTLWTVSGGGYLVGKVPSEVSISGSNPDINLRNILAELVIDGSSVVSITIPDVTGDGSSTVDYPLLDLARFDSSVEFVISYDVENTVSVEYSPTVDTNHQNPTTTEDYTIALD